MNQPMTQQALDAALQQLGYDDKSFAEMYIHKKDAERLGQMQRAKDLTEQLRAMKNAAQQNMDNMSLQNFQSVYGHGIAQGVYKPQFPMPNFGQQGNIAANPVPPAGPPPLDEESPRADAAQDSALKAMNPIARHRFEPVIKLMGIKVRFTNASYTQVKQWILARMGKDGSMIRQEWTAPSKDPGCSLLTWQAMIGEFLDEVARRDGIEIPTGNDQHTSAESAGNEAAGSVGNS